MTCGVGTPGFHQCLLCSEAAQDTAGPALSSYMLICAHAHTLMRKLMLSTHHQPLLGPYPKCSAHTVEQGNTKFNKCPKFSLVLTMGVVDIPVALEIAKKISELPELLSPTS